MKLGVICDGISLDLSHALNVMDEFDLEYAELQFVGEKEVGDHSPQEISDINQLLRDRGKPVSCLSRHIFAGMSSANRPGDALHVRHMDALRRVIEMAHIVGSPLVRIMTQRKEQLDYNYTITEGPLYDATTIYSYVPVDPRSYESIVYSGSNSYHFLEIPLNIGYKTTISPNFELRTQLGASYMALRNREGKKGNFTTLELEDLQDLQFAQHNIAANVKTGLYLNKQCFVVGIEPTFGINLNSLRSAETSAIKTKPYGYGLNITSAIKLFKL